MRRSSLAFASCVAFPVLSVSVFAGPLNPPVGPIAPTPGPEPRTPVSSVNTPGDANSIYRITQPGSYYLTGNVAGVSGKATIEVAASNVTIDLNGFNLSGVAGGIAAVTNEGVLKAVTVRNGSISGWPEGGVDFEGANRVSSAALRELRFIDCTLTAALVGAGSIIESCTFDFCGGAIYADRGSVVRDCTIRECDGQAIGLGASSLVERCVVTTTLASTSSAITLLGQSSTVRGCTLSGGFIGVSAEPNAVIEDNTISGFSNLGIAGADGMRALRNTITNCDSAGIWIRGSYAVIEDNTVRDMKSGGTASGIFSSAGEQRNTVRGNSIISCDVGLQIKGGGNAIYKNELTGNTKQADIAANNRVGPLATGTLSPAINGSTGGNGMGSTDPTANIIY